MASPSIRAGLDTLRANPMRTLLSTLGVIIGSASLVAVLSLGDGAEAFARKRIQQEGYNHILVEPITSDSVDGARIARDTVVSMGPADAAALSAAIGSRATGTFTAEGSILWTPGTGAHPRGLRVVGVAPVGSALPTLTRLVAGRGLTADECRTDSGLSVVSARLGALIVAGRTGSAGNAAAAIGTTVSIGDRAWQVVGVQEDLAGDRGFTMIVPFLSSLAVLRDPGRRVVLDAARLEDIGALTDDIRRWADARPGWSHAIRVEASGQRRLQEIERSFLWFKMLMGAFTAISLIVGGIGIMNVLLASVVERTREIGIRKAVGAKRHDIALQFLTESVAISAVGSLVGLVIGLSGAFGMTAMMRAKTSVPMYAGLTWSTLAAGIASALLVGVIFGTYPALRASRLSPVDAIQRE
jgi:putative ABC transport system permease protein